MSSLQLLGLKHTGKSSVGRLWATRHNWAFFDLDTLLEAKAGGGRTSRQIYLDEGKSGFQKYETEAAKLIAGRLAQGRAVLAWGGGTITNPEAVEVLRSVGTLVVLVDRAEVLFDRIMKGGRPAFLSEANPKKDFLALYEERSALLRDLTPWSVDLAGTNPEAACERLDQIWKTIPNPVKS